MINNNNIKDSDCKSFSKHISVYGFSPLSLVTFFQTARPDLNFLFASTFSSLMPGFIFSFIRPGVYFIDGFKKFQISPSFDVKRALSFNLMFVLDGVFIALLNCSRAYSLCRGCNLFEHKSEILFIQIIY